MYPAFSERGAHFGIWESLTSERNIHIIAFTIGQALLSSAASVVLALPGAYYLARHRFRGRSALLALTTIPFVIPPLVLSVGFLALFGAQGYINDALAEVFGPGYRPSFLYTPYAIILAHVFLNFPIALRILHSRFETFGGSLIRSSELMGAGPVRTFIKVVLPQMRYSILAAASLVFTFSFLSFGVIMVIGGMTNATIEVEIFRQFSGGNDRIAAGSLLLVQTLVLLVSTAIYLSSSRVDLSSPGIIMGSGIADARRVGRSSKVAIIVYVVAAAVLIIGPLSAVAISSFHQGAASSGNIMLGNYRSVLSREDDPTIGATPLGAIENSVLFAFIATCVTVPISVIGAYLMDSRTFRGKSILDVLILFPIGSSAIALGYGLASGDPGAMLSGTWPIIVLVHVLLAYPFCIRTIYASKKGLDPLTVRSASLMGASGFRIFKDIELPVLMPGITVAAAFAFAISIGELGATYMVFSPEYATMPVALYQFISGGRDIGAVAAYSVILMIVTGSSILIVDQAVRYLGRWVRWL